MTVVGVISDTHGLLRPKAVEALRGVDHIIHAGDIGRLDILDELRQLAPVAAIRGNVDVGAELLALPEQTTVEIARRRIHILHDLKALQLNRLQPRPHIVVSGHTHKPHAEHREGIHYLNPGSAGPRRFTLPISLALMHLTPGNEPRVQFIDLEE
jgi:putative phosphoesterase